MTRIAINGFGRIGRAFLKTALGNPALQVVAINDLGDIENAAYLLAYDSAYGRSGISVSVKPGELVIEGKTVIYLSEKDPAKLPWKDLAIDIAIEATGAFETYEKANAHIVAGAKRVILTAPSKDEVGGETIIMGVNDDKLATAIVTSNASCTTNAASPLLAILHEAIGIERAILNTVHAYTASQSLIDGPGKKGDFRRGRAAAHNIVPSTTGAAVAVTKAFTALSGKFDGVAIRVPIISGSLVDVTFVASRPTTPEEVNAALQAAAQSERWKAIFSVTEEELVSSDILGEHYAAIADLTLTKVVDGTLVKVLAWYDNEMGYANTLVQHVVKLGATLK